MQILYGVRITDRVTVQPFLPSGFMAFFDGEPIGQVERTGEAAVRGALVWLRERAEQREKLRQNELITEARLQVEADTIFLNETARQLNIDLDRLIEIIKRRIS